MFFVRRGRKVRKSIRVISAKHLFKHPCSTVVVHSSYVITSSGLGKVESSTLSRGSAPFCSNREWFYSRPESRRRRTRRVSSSPFPPSLSSLSHLFLPAKPLLPTLPSISLSNMATTLKKPRQPPRSPPPPSSHYRSTTSLSEFCPHLFLLFSYFLIRSFSPWFTFFLSPPRHLSFKSTHSQLSRNPHLSSPLRLPRSPAPRITRPSRPRCTRRTHSLPLVPPRRALIRARSRRGCGRQTRRWGRRRRGRWGWKVQVRR